MSALNVNNATGYKLALMGILWFKHLFSEISVENIDMDFLADLAFLGSKLIIIKKWPSLYVNL